MALDRDNFEAWYASVLESLFPRRDAGIIIATIAFPLLERFIRQKVGIPASQSLDDRFHDELRALVSGFADRQQAKNFWAAFRNGLLHQVTLQLETSSGAQLPPCALTHDIERVFAVSDSGLFLLHPVLFAKRVIDIIRSDFETFVGQVHIGPPLAKARPFVVYGSNIQSTMTVSTSPFTVLGTSGRS
jgi:hypothetical protein